MSDLNIPENFHYFRSCSLGYRKYLEKCGVKVFDIGNTGFYGWYKRFFWGAINLVKFERLDIEPDISEIKKSGLNHGIVIRIPNKNIVPSIGWKRVFFPTHFMKTGYTTLSSNYKQFWNSRAKRALKRFLNSGCEIVQVDGETFTKEFKKCKCKIPHKGIFMRYHSSLYDFDPKNMRNYLAYYNGKVVSGLGVYDYDNYSTVHIVAFHNKDAKDIQAGTGLIDRWFSESVEKGLKYINFDHLRDGSMTPDQQGYTTFKMNFMEKVLEFKKSYFKIF